LQQILGAESSNECNPDCNGETLTHIPTMMRRLLPPGYSQFLGESSNILVGVSPRRAKLQGEVGKALGKQGRVMQRIAERHMGALPIIGDIVQGKNPDVDRWKSDAPCLTAVVVEVSYDIIDCYLYYI
jgi:hypothetical protein